MKLLAKIQRIDEELSLTVSIEKLQDQYLTKIILQFSLLFVINKPLLLKLLCQ